MRTQTLFCSQVVTTQGAMKCPCCEHEHPLAMPIDACFFSMSVRRFTPSSAQSHGTAVCFAAILFVLVFLLNAPVTASTSQCQKDLAAVDAGIGKQYGEDRTWWNILACPVCLGSELRKDAIVSKMQIREISTMRNMAYLQMSRGDERLCVDTLKTPKRMLRLS